MSDIIVLVIAVILSMSIHETAHGLVSYWFGDPTAKQQGRLSLNPLHHIDWVGLACLVFFGFGWAKPVDVDPRYYKDPKTGMIWTAFAGPVANFLLTFICLLVYCLCIKFSMSFFLSEPGYLILNILSRTAAVSAGLGIFNLIPVPPLDGSKVLLAFLPDEQYFKITNSNVGMTILVLLLAFGLLDNVMSPLLSGFIQITFQLCTTIVGI